MDCAFFFPSCSERPDQSHFWLPPCGVWKDLQSMVNECKGHDARFSAPEELGAKKNASRLFVWTDAAQWGMLHARIAERNGECGKQCVIWDVPTTSPLLLNPNWGYVFDTSSISEECQLGFYSRFGFPLFSQIPIFGFMVANISNTKFSPQVLDMDV